MEAMICSTVTPGARSNNLKPCGVTSKTANSVTTFLTQPTPVNGNVHLLRIFDSPTLLTCIMATIMFSADATKSIAPPIPLTILPGIFQLAISPFSATSMAPRIVKSTCCPRIIPKLNAESKKLAPGKVVMVCFPALIKSASSSPSKGNGPMPRIPFSL